MTQSVNLPVPEARHSGGDKRVAEGGPALSPADGNPVATAEQTVSKLPVRIPRCQVLDISKRGTNRCQNEATDNDDSVLLCLDHRIKIIQDLAALPGIEIVITAQPAHVRTTP